MWITRTSVAQPVFATMVMLALVVLGAVAYTRLPVEHLPDVTNPEVSVTVDYPGASPEAVETDVVRPMENVVNTVNGVRHIYSTMLEGQGELQIEFGLDVDVNAAIQEIRDKVAQIEPTLPRDAKTPLISRADYSANQQPVATLAVSSETRSLREISDLVQHIVVKRLQNVSGVGQVNVTGSVVRQIQIQLHPGQLRSFGISIDEVIQAIRDANQDLPAGSIVAGPRQQLVRVEGRIKDPTAFGRIIVATRSGPLYLQQGGVPIYLDQIADVVDGQAEATSISRFDGRPSVGLQVYKVQKSNVVAVGEGIKKAVAELGARLPPDVHARVVYANSDWIKNSLTQVKETILEGGLLTIVIVFLFLHSWRSTIITGLTLPIAVIATFVALYAFGFTLNFLTLMALSLCIGLLIDDAIVVRENIVRHLAMGKDHRRAALEGTEEIGLAVIATTLAIVAVFVPVAFMRGIIGRYFFQFGITVAVAVLVSLFVSFTLDPMLSSLWPDPPERRFAYAPWLGRLMETIERGIDALHRAYGRLLAWSLQNRVTVLTFAAAVFFGSFLMLPLIGTEFQPSADEGFISLRLRTPTGSSLEYTDAKVRQVERILRGLPEIADIATSVGTEEGINTARLDLRLVDRSRIRRRNQKTIEQALRRRLAPVAGVQVSLGWNKPIFVSVLGPEPAVLTDIAQKLMREMARIPGIADLESSEQAAEPTLAVRIRQDVAADLGLTNAAIGNALRPLIAGDQISHWLAPDGQDYDVTVRLPRNDRRVATDIGDLYLTSARLDSDGSPLLVPLRQVADLVETSTPAQLKRLDLQRRVSIYANAQGRATGDVGRDVRKLLEHTPLPPGYRFDIGGAQQDMDESFSAALQALALAVIFIYLILASQFASFLQPVAIMASLPLSLTGVFLALLLTHTTLNLFSIIGFIMLMGLVTKNAILLVDFTNRGLRDGKTLPAAILDAGQVRLRPILMTTCAMVFGMLPMAIGFGEGGELQAPMGRAVIGGVITSTLLTLVVVPVIYSYLYALSSRARRLWGAAAGPAQPLPSAATPPDIADDCADAIADDVAIDDAPVASSAQ